MNLDELAAELERLSDDPVVDQLAGLLMRWKADDSTVNDLRNDIERFIGNIWVEKAEEHSHMYAVWSDFRDNEIDLIGGKTMNERLYSFSLFERFDSCVDEEDRLIVYQKLLASL